MVPVVGLKPTRVLAQRILSPPRLPFQHTSILYIIHHLSKNSKRIFSDRKELQALGLQFPPNEIFLPVMAIFFRIFGKIQNFS